MIENSKNLLNTWKEIASSKIYFIDTLDSIKFRKKQTLFSIFTALILLGLGSWGFMVEVYQRNWASSSICMLSLIYVPLIVNIFIWFRGLSIFDFAPNMRYEEEKPRTKKDDRASLSFKISSCIFLFYYCYFIFRLMGVFWSLGTIIFFGILVFLSKDRSYEKS